MCNRGLVNVRVRYYFLTNHIGSETIWSLMHVKIRYVEQNNLKAIMTSNRVVFEIGIHFQVRFSFIGMKCAFTCPVRVDDEGHTLLRLGANLQGPGSGSSRRGGVAAGPDDCRAHGHPAANPALLQ